MVRPITNSQVDRAGKRIRKTAKSGGAPAAADISLLDEFRALYVPVLDTIQSELVTRLHKKAKLSEERYPVTSRLKTPPAIIAKLGRSKTALSRMGDIAGARIVVPGLDLQDTVAEYVETCFSHCSPVIKEQRERPDDYGYRAIHVLVRLDGRPAEIQLRTIWQDRWAQVVESVDSSRGLDLKHGRGPADWLDWLMDLSFEFRKADLGESFDIPPTPLDQLIEQENES